MTMIGVDPGSVNFAICRITMTDPGGELEKCINGGKATYPQFTIDHWEIWNLKQGYILKNYCNPSPTSPFYKEEDEVIQDRLKSKNTKQRSPPSSQFKRMKPTSLVRVDVTKDIYNIDESLHCDTSIINYPINDNAPSFLKVMNHFILESPWIFEKTGEAEGVNNSIELCPISVENQFDHIESEGMRFDMLLISNAFPHAVHLLDLLNLRKNISTVDPSFLPIHPDTHQFDNRERISSISSSSTVTSSRIDKEKMDLFNDPKFLMSQTAREVNRNSKKYGLKNPTKGDHKWRKAESIRIAYLLLRANGNQEWVDFLDVMKKNGQKLDDLTDALLLAIASKRKLLKAHLLLIKKLNKLQTPPPSSQKSKIQDKPIEQPKVPRVLKKRKVDVPIDNTKGNTSCFMDNVNWENYDKELDKEFDKLPVLFPLTSTPPTSPTLITTVGNKKQPVIQRTKPSSPTSSKNQVNRPKEDVKHDDLQPNSYKSFTKKMNTVTSPVTPKRKIVEVCNPSTTHNKKVKSTVSSVQKKIDDSVDREFTSRTGFLKQSTLLENLRTPLKNVSSPPTSSTVNNNKDVANIRKSPKLSYNPYLSTNIQSRLSYQPKLPKLTDVYHDNMKQSEDKKRKLHMVDKDEVTDPLYDSQDDISRIKNRKLVLDEAISNLQKEPCSVDAFLTSILETSSQSFPNATSKPSSSVMIQIVDSEEDRDEDDGYPDFTDNFDLF